MEDLTLRHANPVSLVESFSTTLFVDVYLKAKCGRKFTAHKLILGSVSPLLHSILQEVPQGESVTLILPDEDEKTVQLLLSFVYSGIIQCTQAEYEDISDLINVFSMDNFQLCFDAIKSETSSSSNNVHVDSSASTRKVAVDGNGLRSLHKGTLSRQREDDLSLDLFLGSASSLSKHKHGNSIRIGDTNISLISEATSSSYYGQKILNSALYNDPMLTDALNSSALSAIISSREKSKPERSAYKVDLGNDSVLTLNSFRQDQVNLDFPYSVQARHQSLVNCEIGDGVQVGLNSADVDVEMSIYDDDDQTEPVDLSGDSEDQSFEPEDMRSKARLVVPTISSKLKSPSRLRIANTGSLSEKEFKCPQCTATYNCERILKAHMTKVHRNRKGAYKCDACDFSSDRQWSFKQHFLTMHTDERPFPCDLCNKSFALNASLVSHRNFVHFNTRPYQCNICGHAAKTMSSLQMHQKGPCARRFHLQSSAIGKDKKSTRKLVLNNTV